MSLIFSRRRALKLLASSALLGCEAPAPGPRRSTLRSDAVVRVEPLERIWQTSDPFLFCAYHLDDYPSGNAQMGPAEALRGRQLGRDFANVDGWNMYHGSAVPGFPRHPHRGFETVTVVQRGLLDHCDSLGATARYGRGDVQWLTAGAGIQHAEMFPLVSQSRDNPLELFQIWLNLPAAKKLVDPHFSMLWEPTIPTRRVRDASGRHTVVRVVAGSLDESGPSAAEAPAPPPASWASESDAHVAIWTLEMGAGATFEVPPAPASVHRSLYYYRGGSLSVDGREVAPMHRVVLRPDEPVRLNAQGRAELLMLQGKPIGEPVARHGPFVMNTDAEIQAAYRDFRRTQFGGWPWPSDEPVHAREDRRFARRPGSEIETPG